MTFRSLILVASLGTAFAQAPNPPARGGQPGPDIHALRAYLNLTDSQMQQIRQAGEQAHKQTAEKAKALQPQIQEKHAALAALLAKGGDATAVGKLMLEIRALEKQAGEARRAMHDSFVSVLTPEQKTRFKAIEDAALLPVAAREAARLGLVPGAEPRMGPRMGQPRQGMGQGARRMGQPGQGPQGFQGPRPMNQGPRPMMQGQRPMMQGPGQQGFQGPNQGPRPMMQGPGPQGFQGPNAQGPGPQGFRPQGARPPQPQQPKPQEEEEEEL